jgi:predicted outer membrane repeat protein
VRSAGRRVLVLSRRFLLAWGTLFLAGVSAAHAATWVVDGSGAGDFTHLSDALRAIASGDEILIEPGSYDDADSLGMEAYVQVIEKSVSILGNGTRPESVSLTGVRTEFWYCPEVAIENVFIHDTVTPLRIFGSNASIRRCRFEDNTTAGWTDGGAIVAQLGGNLIVEDCIFRRNSAVEEMDSGGAISAGGCCLTLTRSYFSDNTSTWVGGAVEAGGWATITDCIFTRNRAAHGGALRFSAYSVVEGCVFWANEVTSPDGAAVEITETPLDVFERCVFGNTRGGYGVATAAPATAECCLFWNNEGGNSLYCVIDEFYGNKFADPLFCDPDASDFGLRADSPCLPENQEGGCGLIGTFGEGCGVSPTHPVSWGQLKFLYR